MPLITQAFVLGAGLGTRLRPLTDQLPKPLVPIFQKPLITFAFDHLLDAGCEKFFVNTHHQPERFDEAFGLTERTEKFVGATGRRALSSYRNVPIDFRHEPVLLETAGGIANIVDSLSNSPLVVYNGDILTDLPLAPLIEEHFRAANIVTLALRSGGGPQHVAFDRAHGRVVDIRNQLETGAPDEFVFTGIYIVNPEFARSLERGLKHSVIPVFLELIEHGEKVGGIVIDEGCWWDVGTRAAYLQLHRDLSISPFPQYPVDDPDWRSAIHKTATIENGATLRGCSVAGSGVRVGAAAILEDTIVWSGAQVASRSHLRNCIVRSHQKAEGTLHDIDI